jgi:predicted phosphodiesterase
VKVAIIADAHGNLQAFEEALKHIRRESPDMVVAAGDMISWFPGGTAIWELLRAEKIHCLKGNNEEFLIFHSQASLSDPIRSSPQFMPVQYAASLFSTTDIKSMEKLSLTITVAGSRDDDLLVCHGSPFDTWKSISSRVDNSLESQFLRARERVIVAGHDHRPWHLRGVCIPYDRDGFISETIKADTWRRRAPWDG